MDEWLIDPDLLIARFLQHNTVVYSLRNVKT